MALTGANLNQKCVRSIAHQNNGYLNCSCESLAYLKEAEDADNCSGEDVWAFIYRQTNPRNKSESTARGRSERQLYLSRTCHTERQELKGMLGTTLETMREPTDLMTVDGNADPGYITLHQVGEVSSRYPIIISLESNPMEAKSSSYVSQDEMDSTCADW